MVCFCNVPLAAAPPMLANMQFSFSPPKIPIALKLAAAIPLMQNSETLNISLHNPNTPRFSMNAQLMLALAMKLKLAASFSLAPETLAMQLGQAASSVNNFAIPVLKPLLKINLPALLQLALIAKLKLSIPMPTYSAMLGGIPPSVPAFNITPGFPLSAVLALNLSAAVPVLVSLAEGMGGPSGLAATLKAMASITPPSLSISLAMLMKINLALEAIATIQAAFGPGAMSPSGLQNIAADLKLLMQLPLPPLPDLALAETLAMLPPSSPGGMPGMPAGLDFRPPNIAIMAQLSAMAALHVNLGALGLAGSCGDLCSIPLGAFG